MAQSPEAHMELGNRFKSRCLIPQRSPAVQSSRDLYVGGMLCFNNQGSIQMDFSKESKREGFMGSH